jgi:hypothetical protein
MMWSWKLIYEDKTFNFFCDIDNVVGCEELNEGFFAGVECYRPLPEKIAVWVSVGIKAREVLRQYIEKRKKAGLSVDGYQDFSYTICLVELDAAHQLYRVIPAADIDKRDQQIGESSLLDGTKDPLVKGLKADWSKIDSPKTSKAITLLFNFFYRPASQNT